MRPTLTDVAKLAGVSVATASRALSNPDLVADSTRRAVREAANSCGYKINLVARSLRIQRTDTIMVLAPGIDDAFYPAVLASIEDTAMALGYAVMVGFTAKSEQHRAAYAELLFNGRVDGMLVMDGGAAVDRFSGPKPELPVVQLFDRVYGSGVPVVRVDDLEVADLAVRHLAGNGHRRIAHIAGPASVWRLAERRRGFVEAIERLGLLADTSLIATCDGGWSSAAQAMAQLLAQPQPPTAVFCATDTMACAALAVCRDHGLAVPRDMALIGADGTADAERAFPILPTVRVPRAEIGARATDMLIGLIRGHHGLVNEAVLPVELLARGAPEPKHAAAAA
ncbi:MAG: LacI family DNA-binding transcriptional regulator [Aestuariivirga sp.]|uniref:LacI family DNA-binding transcriptional regulator n=1 Tax=Aestuariivirga sp. TaxID=2650926 RepID=UPI0038CF87EA